MTRKQLREIIQRFTYRNYDPSNEELQELVDKITTFLKSKQAND